MRRKPEIYSFTGGLVDITGNVTMVAGAARRATAVTWWIIADARRHQYRRVDQRAIVDASYFSAADAGLEQLAKSGLRGEQLPSLAKNDGTHPPPTP